VDDNNTAVHSRFKLKSFSKYRNQHSKTNSEQKIQSKNASRTHNFPSNNLKSDKKNAVTITNVSDLIEIEYE